MGRVLLVCCVACFWTFVVTTVTATTDDVVSGDPVEVREDHGTSTDTETSDDPVIRARERLIRKYKVALAEEQFPDNVGLTWHIHGFEHRDHLTFVEAEPEPDTVGYPRFRFVVSFKIEDEPETVATYAWIDDRFQLLSTSPTLEDELPKTLE